MICVHQTVQNINNKKQNSHDSKSKQPDHKDL